MSARPETATAGTMPAIFEELAPDLRRLRVAMRRFAPVNAWVIGQSRGRTPGQAIIDSTHAGEVEERAWLAAEASGGLAAVEAVLCTHHHRDHSGLVGFLSARHGVPLWMSAAEDKALRTRMALPLAEATERLQGLYRFCGFSPEETAFLEAPDYGIVSPLPARIRLVEEGMVLRLGGAEFRVLCGGGHSPQAACLLSESRRLLVAGDQLLPGGGPQIVVFPDARDADPLTDYLAFLDRAEELPDDLLVLPGHGDAFTGPATRAGQIRAGHMRRLERMRAAAAARPASCADLAQSVFPDQSAAQFGEVMPGMVLALANHLWRRGDLRREIGADGIARFEAAS